MNNREKTQENVRRLVVTQDALRDVRTQWSAVLKEIQKRHPDPAPALLARLNQLEAEDRRLTDRCRELYKAEGVLVRGFVAGLNNQDHAAFQETGNAGFVWRTWKRTRAMGAPMPDWVLDAFDGWAAGVVPLLEGGAKPKALAAALGLTRPGGGPSIAAQMKTVYERRDLAIAVLNEQADDRTAAAEAISTAMTQKYELEALMKIGRAKLRPIDDIFRLIAEQCGVSTEHVRESFYDRTDEEDVVDSEDDWNGLFACGRRLKNAK
jgi:hypothetical protein